METSLSTVAKETGMNRGFQADLNLSFIELLAKIQTRLLSMGHNTVSPTTNMVAVFDNLDFARREFVLEVLHDNLASVNEASTEHWRIGQIDRLCELRSLSRYLSSRRLVLARPELMNLIDEDDVIEIYNTEGIQIYRSWSCFRVCSYSLVDLLLHDWDTLYERPTSVVAHISECIANALSPDLPLVTYGVPEYLIAERFEGHDNVFHFNMKNITAVLDAKTRRPVGVCSTGSAKLAKTRKDAKKLKFI